jgi:hypothetical protein
VAVFPLAALAGLLAGRAAGGRVSALARLRLRSLWLVALALAIEVACGIGSSPYLRTVTERMPLVLASDLLVGGWIVANIAGRARSLRIALYAVGLGWLANLMPIALDGGMPVSPRALAEAGLSHIDVTRGHLGKHVLASSAHGTLARTALALGDWIPVRQLGTVMSPGDLLMAAGIGLLVAAAMFADRGEPVPSTLLGDQGAPTVAR